MSGALMMKPIRVSAIAVTITHVIHAALSTPVLTEETVESLDPEIGKSNPKVSQKFKVLFSVNLCEALESLW